MATGFLLFIKLKAYRPEVQAVSHNCFAFSDKENIKACLFIQANNTWRSKQIAVLTRNLTGCRFFNLTIKLKRRMI